MSTCPGRRGCNPIVSPDPPTGQYTAWCKPCAWEGPLRSAAWRARIDADQRVGKEQQQPPPWARGPWGGAA